MIFIPVVGLIQETPLAIPENWEEVGSGGQPDNPSSDTFRL
jgi:hypothetical protein